VNTIVIIGNGYMNTYKNVTNKFVYIETVLFLMIKSTLYPSLMTTTDKMHKFILRLVILSLFLSSSVHAGSTSYVQANGQTVAKINESGIYYIHSDHLGSTSVVTNEAGDLVEDQVNLPFGEVVSGNEKYGFTGKEQDETGLQYFGARYYSPNSGRFLNPDPALQDFSSYGYAGGNPVNRVDPDGRFFKRLGRFVKGLFRRPEQLSDGELWDRVHMIFLEGKEGEIIVNANQDFNTGVSTEELKSMKDTISDFIKTEIFKKNVVDLDGPEYKNRPPIPVILTNDKRLIGDHMGRFSFKVLDGEIIWFSIIINSEIGKKGLWLRPEVYGWKYHVDAVTRLKLITGHEFTHPTDLIIKGKFKEFVAYMGLSKEEKEKFKKENPGNHKLVNQQYDDYEDNAHNAERILATDLIKDRRVLQEYTESVRRRADSQRREGI